MKTQINIVFKTGGDTIIISPIVRNFVLNGSTSHGSLLDFSCFHFIESSNLNEAKLEGKRIF